MRFPVPIYAALAIISLPSAIVYPQQSTTVSQSYTVDPEHRRLDIKLPTLIEGFTQRVEVILSNSTGEHWKDVQAVGSCSCIASKETNGKSCENGQSLPISIQIKPTKDKFFQAIELRAKNAEGRYKTVCQITVDAETKPPISVSHDKILLNKNSATQTIKLRTNHKAILLNPDAITSLNSKIVVTSAKQGSIENEFVLEISHIGEPVPDGFILNVPFLIDGPESKRTIDIPIAILDQPAFNISPRRVVFRKEANRFLALAMVVDNRGLPHDGLSEYKTEIRSRTTLKAISPSPNSTVLRKTGDKTVLRITLDEAINAEFPENEEDLELVFVDANSGQDLGVASLLFDKTFR